MWGESGAGRSPQCGAGRAQPMGSADGGACGVGGGAERYLSAGGPARRPGWLERQSGADLGRERAVKRTPTRSRRAGGARGEAARKAGGARRRRRPGHRGGLDGAAAAAQPEPEGAARERNSALAGVLLRALAPLHTHHPPRAPDGLASVKCHDV